MQEQSCSTHNNRVDSIPTAAQVYNQQSAISCSSLCIKKSSSPHRKSFLTCRCHPKIFTIAVHTDAYKTRECLSSRLQVLSSMCGRPCQENACLLNSQEHGTVPGAQAGKVGQEAIVERQQPALPVALCKTVQHALVLPCLVSCTERSAHVWQCSASRSLQRPWLLHLS